MKPFLSQPRSQQSDVNDALTEARIISGVVGLFFTCTQYQAPTPPMALARVKDGMLYMPDIKSVLKGGNLVTSASYQWQRQSHQESIDATAFRQQEFWRWW